jgi:hypothetical protein
MIICYAGYAIDREKDSRRPAKSIQFDFGDNIPAVSYLTKTIIGPEPGQGDNRGTGDRGGDKEGWVEVLEIENG